MKSISQLKAFIVDDDPFSTELYKKHLTDNGFTSVVCFDNGQDCLNQLTQEPSIIFLDYQMQPLNGLEVLKKIKRFDPDIFIVLISAQLDMQVAINALKYGAFDYIIKGQNDLQMMDHVLEKISRIVTDLSQRNKKGWSLLSLKFLSSLF